MVARRLANTTKLDSRFYSVIKTRFLKGSSDFGGFLSFGSNFGSKLFGGLIENTKKCLFSRIDRIRRGGRVVECGGLENR